MNIHNFNHILAQTTNSISFDPETKVAVLKTGLYGKYCGIEIHVDRGVRPDCFQFKQELDHKWSADIELNLFQLLKQSKLDRLLALKAFW